MKAKENILQEELKKAEVFFQEHMKGDKVMYKLYTIKHPDSLFNYKDQRAKNLTAETLGEGMQALKEDIYRVGDKSKEYFAVRYMGGLTDGSPMHIVLDNPFYDETIQKGYRGNKTSGIYGFDSSPNVVLELMKQNHNLVSGLKEEMQELKHNYAIEKMNDRLEDLEQNKRTSIDSIGDFFQTDLGQTLATGILGLLAKNSSAPPLQQPINTTATEQPINKPPRPQQQTDPENLQSEGNEQVQKLNEALNRMDTVFQGEGVQAMLELAIYCQNNPQIAKTLRAKNQTE